MLIGQKLWPPGDGAYMAKVKKKLNQVSDPGPSWSSCLFIGSSGDQHLDLNLRINSSAKYAKIGFP